MAMDWQAKMGNTMAKMENTMVKMENTMAKMGSTIRRIYEIIGWVSSNILTLLQPKGVVVATPQ